MNLNLRWILTAVVYLAPWSRSHSSTKKKLIVDTDLFSDVDDTGALLLACSHANVSLLGVNLNYPSTYTALAASSLLGYYGHTAVPIGIKRPLTNDTFLDIYAYQHGEYASKVAYHWQTYSSLPWMDVTGTWDSVELYRRVLSQEDDQSVTIASIGFLDNLSNLLASGPDSHSPLSGRDLVAAKVSELAVMGGEYPSGHEFNFFGHNITAAADVVNTWPGRVTFIGFELGRDVYSGGQLMVDGPESDPVNAAYRWYNGYDVPRESWDPLTVLYAIEGLGDIFKYGNSGGHNHVFPNGSNAWQAEGDGHAGQHRYLKLNVSPAAAGALLDRLFLRGAVAAAKDSGCSKYEPSLCS
ncbi:inosine-uridine preferring nucleoside hydrolase-domain-containing protein [Aspergillus candidus]|uniref:Inosine-uridine preferring nucleoside hydrolase-domain-containing protein n=1 Tax=Aspergillus candidus TaxID=41067 RepID=A0A2I2F845_ASPCN|nr:inosine-uridine preferring nucleoside hydrolase-domain-containing protein [Aspergillus candidus]PLB36802.1 inosine-uridine preferring nucleoside hydrolase-domain-containing protein [Aspergillus candidus]